MPLPGLDKAEGREPAAAPKTAEELQVAYDQLKEATDAERVALTRDIERWKSKFKNADAEVQRYQTAVAALVGAESVEDRQAIRDGLTGA